MQQFVLVIRVSEYIKTDIELCSQSDLAYHTLPQPHDCPDMCSCGCTDFAEGPFILVDCSSRNLSAVPQFLKHNNTGIKVRRIASKFRTISRHNKYILYAHKKDMPQ